MSISYEELRFWDAYGLAENIRFAVEEDTKGSSLESYFDICDKATRARFSSPQRWTLLHQFIQDWFLTYNIYRFEHYRNDMLDLIVAEYKSILKGYDISFTPINTPNELDVEYEKNMQVTIAYLRSLLPIKRIANETFQLLFRDREFLLQLNQLISKSVSGMKADIFADVLSKDGIIRRKNLPVWAKRGVFYRDQGRCIYCGKDLTGTIITGEEVHYDHIVPLAKSGTNDPINFQLLCRKCNLEKSTRIFTSNMYPVYWNVETPLIEADST